MKIKKIGLQRRSSKILLCRSASVNCPQPCCLFGRQTKITSFLFPIIMSMWPLYLSILAVLGAECMCCENVFISKFHSFSCNCVRVCVCVCVLLLIFGAVSFNQTHSLLEIHDTIKLYDLTASRTPDTPSVADPGFLIRGAHPRGEALIYYLP